MGMMVRKQGPQNLWMKTLFGTKASADLAGVFVLDNFNGHCFILVWAGRLYW